MKPEERLSKAKASLILDHPFFGALSMKLPLKKDEAVPTACTNGVEIRYNPEWVMSLSDVELRGVMAHEVMHVSNGHSWRRGERQPKRWNIAADYAINRIIIDAGLKLPEGGLITDTAKSAEQIYQELPEDQDEDKPAGQRKQGRGQDPGNCGAVEDAPGNTDTDSLDKEWRVAVVQAAQVARSMGDLPESIERMVQSIIDPKVDWTVLLRDFVEMTTRNDYNWSKPNRRYITSGIVLPSLISEELPEIVLFVDTSGSIDEDGLNLFAAQASAILESFDTTVHVVYVDLEIQGHGTYSRADMPIQLKPKGGGGTDFRPAFEWVEQQGLEPACAIYLTDLMGRFPEQAPDYPVLWVSQTKPIINVDVPFGDTIVMN